MGDPKKITLIVPKRENKGERRNKRVWFSNTAVYPTNINKMSAGAGCGHAVR